MYRALFLTLHAGILLSHPGLGYLFLTHHAGILLSHPGVGYLFLTHHAGILLSHPGLDISFLHTMPGYCYLTPGGISFSYTPCRDTAISPRVGIYISSLSRLRQCNYFFMTTTKKIFSSLNYPKLPLYL